MIDQVVHHYPPELLDLLVNAVPRLIKGKQGVLDFFKGCGVGPSLFTDLQSTVTSRRNEITKYEIVRQILKRLNDLGDSGLRERREVLRRVTQWDDYSLGYETDRMEAEGYVARIQKLVNVKDSFTRMQRETDQAKAELRQQREQAALERQRVREERVEIRARLNSLFESTDPHERGAQLEGVLNDLFRSFGILIRESFRSIGQHGEGVIEQIDGVVELSGEIYLVEMKWWANPLGPDVVAQHLVRVFQRHAARGILISHSGFTDAGIQMVRESLSQAVFVLAELREIVLLLEKDGSLTELLSEKVRAAVIDKNPMVRPFLGVS